MYQLRGRLGRWGFGELYEAVESDTGVHRMLKVVRGRRASDPHIHAHMVQEFEVADCCSHPHVVAIQNMEEDPALGIYHVMDFVRGETLGAAVKRGLTFPPNKVLEIVGAAASALALLEAHGQAHHEFCPETLYLPAKGPSPWVISFGLPPSAGSHPPLPLEALAYAAPERKAAQVWDNRADVYSVCAVLLQLLVGRPPPPQGWIQFPRPAGASELGDSLYELAKRGLSPTPGQRYPSMEALFGAMRFLAESHGIELAPAESRGAANRPPRPAPKRTVLGMSALTPPGQPTAQAAQGGPPPPPVAVRPRESRPAKPVRAPTRPKIPAGGPSRPSRGTMKKTVLGMGVLTEADIHGAGRSGRLSKTDGAARLDGTSGARSGSADQMSGKAPPSSTVESSLSGLDMGPSSHDGAVPLDDLGDDAGFGGSRPVLLGDVRGGTPLDELSLPGAEVSSPGGRAPLEPDAFPGAETGAQGAFDPSVVSELPMPDGQKRRRLAIFGLAGGLGLGAVILVLLFLWPGFVRKKGGSQSGGERVAGTGESVPARSSGSNPDGGTAQGPGASRQRAPRVSGGDAGLGGQVRSQGLDAGLRARSQGMDAGHAGTPDAGKALAGPDASSGEDGSRPQSTSRYKHALTEGRKAMRHHKYALARHFFTKAHHLRPRSVTPMRLMARAHYRAHEYPAARFWYEKAIERSPRSASLHAQLGKVYGRLGKRSKACRHFVKALSLRPNSRRYRMAVQNYRCSH